MLNSAINIFKTSTKWAVGLSAAAGTVAIGVTSIKTVPPNTVAFRNVFGNISKEPMDPGIHFPVNPFANLIQMSLVKRNYKSNITVASNEGLSIGVGTNVIYRVRRDSAHNIYTTYFHNYVEKELEPLIKSSIREIMTGFQAKDLYNIKTRDSIRLELENRVVKKMKQDGFDVSGIYVSDIRLPQSVSQSIENKLKVEQQNEQMVFEIEKERQMAFFKKEKTQIEAERKVIEANGIKKFQDIVAEGISPELIAWKSIEATKLIAQSNNAKVIIIGNKDTKGLPIILGNN